MNHLSELCTCAYVFCLVSVLSAYAFVCSHLQAFEPYIIMQYKYTPWYDERFRGRIANKAVQIWAVRLYGFRFLVHPTLFVLHFPHEHIQRLDALNVLYPNLKESFKEKVR